MSLTRACSVDWDVTSLTRACGVDPGRDASELSRIET